MDRTNDALSAAFAKVLREQRDAAGLTQEQLAERAEVSVRHISFMETGRRQPTLASLVALASGLGLTLAEFAGQIEAVVLAAKDVRVPE